MPYAADGRLGHDPIPGGIEITEHQYQQGLAGMLAGEHVQIVDGSFFIGPKPEPDPEPEPEAPLDWPAMIEARRWQIEVGGIALGGLTIATDDRSKLLINGAALEALMSPQYVMQWKTPDGFVDLSADQVLAVARAVRAHVQSCFDREAELLTLLAAGRFEAAMLDAGWPAEPPVQGMQESREFRDAPGEGT